MLHLKSWEQLKCSLGSRVGVFSPPSPCSGGPAIEAPESLITGIFSAVNTYKKKTPEPDNSIFNKRFLSEAGANIVH